MRNAIPTCFEQRLPGIGVAGIWGDRMCMLTRDTSMSSLLHVVEN